MSHRNVFAFQSNAQFSETSLTCVLTSRSVRTAREAAPGTEKEVSASRMTPEEPSIQAA
jgi:hypothetical protein